MRRSPGHGSRAEATPARTRCFASWHARSARPTIENEGTPLGKYASTSTRRGSRPTSAYVTARASTFARYGCGRHASVPIWSWDWAGAEVVVHRPRKADAFEGLEIAAPPGRLQGLSPLGFAFRRIRGRGTPGFAGHGSAGERIRDCATSSGL